MQQLAMRRLSLAAVLLAALLPVGCGSDEPAPATDLEQAADYLGSAAARRQFLEDSIVNPENGYSKRRLENYTEAGWGALPVWNPRVRPVVAADLGAGVPSPDETWSSLPIDFALEDAKLNALGEQVFKNYPNQVEPGLIAALTDAAAPERFGLWTGDGRIGGLVWVELPDGVQPAFTCSSCHTANDESGALVYGAPNHRFDYAAVLDVFHGVPPSADGWGPGRVDTTPDDVDNPPVIADLRVARFQQNFNRAATLRGGLMSLVLRLETAIIVASDEGIRPPREMVLGLSWYLWSLGEILPLPADGAGREVFARECASCHQFPGLAGPPTPLEQVGTDSTVGDSPWRTTGKYQTPSLRGVARRGRLMAEGDVDSLESVLDGSRAAPGHRYGTDLVAADHAALLEFLEQLK